MTKVLQCILAVTTAALLLAPGAAAQGQRPQVQDPELGEPGRYTAALVGGYTRYDESSALKDAVYGGFEAAYFVVRNFGIGPYVAVSRPITDATFFPMNRLEFADTVIHYLVSQQVLAFDVGVAGKLRVLMGPVELQATGGIGRYSIRLDPQRAERPTTPGSEVWGFGGWQYSVGGGASVRLGRGGAIQAKVQDWIYTDYERDKLSLSEPLLSARNVPHPRPDAPEVKSVIHNLRYEIGFSFTPRGGQ